MKKFLLLIILLAVVPSLQAQMVTGKMVNQAGAGLAGLKLHLYINPKVYTTTTLTDGSFAFPIVTSVVDEQLPTGYSVANNYPNPFNPTTRFEITMPSGTFVSADIFNVLGEQVLAIRDRFFHAGTNFLDVELDGNPNGFYVARITLDGKFSVVKKMMLLYGSRHLPSAYASGKISGQLNKTLSGSFSAQEIKIDSLVAISAENITTVFKSLPPISSGVVNLGNLAITTPVPLPPMLSTPGNGASDQNTAVTFSWKASTDAATYALQISSDTAFSSIVYDKNGLSVSGLEVKGLSSSTVYYWRVQAANTYGSSRWSDRWSFTTRNNPPSTPSNPNPKNYAVGVPPSTTLYWSSVDVDGDTVKYDVYFGTSSDPTTRIATDLMYGMPRQDGLSAGTTYYWKVVAKDHKGLIAHGPVWSFTTIDSSLYAPSNLTLASLTDTSVSLRWYDNNYFEAGTFIERSADGITYTLVDSAAADSTTKIVSGAYQDGVMYSFKIRAFAGVRTSTYSNAVSIGKGVSIFGGLGSNEEAGGIATDSSGNLYASMKLSGTGNGIRKFIAGTDSSFNYAPAGGVSQWTGLKIGPGGMLFGARVQRAIYTLPAGGAPVLWAQSVTSVLSDIDFDHLGCIWAVGNNAHVYRFKLADRSVKMYPFPALLRSVRIFNGYVYAAGRKDSTEGVWRFRLNAADSSIGAAEEYFNLSKQPGYGYNGPTATAITFNTDGEMYLGTSGAAGILLVAPGGKSFQPLYPGFFTPTTIAFAWGKGGTLFAVRSVQGSVNTLLKINTHKTGAPYYGAR